MHQPLDQFLSTRFALPFRNFLFFMYLNIDTPHNPLRPCSRSCLLPRTYPQNFSIPFRHMIIRHKSNGTSGTVLGRNAVPQYFFKFLWLSLTAENLIEYWENIYLDTAPHLDTISYLDTVTCPTLVRTQRPHPPLHGKPDKCSGYKVYYSILTGPRMGPSGRLDGPVRGSEEAEFPEFLGSLFGFVRENDEMDFSYWKYRH